MDTTFRNPNLGSSKKSPTINFQIPHNTYNIIIAQQSLPQNKYQYIFPVFDVTKKFEESLQKCREKNNKRLKIKAIEKVNISKTLSQNLIENYKRANSMPGNIKHENFPEIKVRERCVSMTETNDSLKSRRASELVDQLLLDIYGRGNYPNENLGGKFDTEYGSSTSFKSIPEKFDEKMQYSRLLTKDISELRMLITALRDRITYTGNLLVKQLKKKDALRSKQEKICNVITAHLHAFSHKKSEDTNMRFSPNPAPGDSGFNQWQDAMKMVAKLPGGIPPEFRKKLWIALAEKHLQSRGVNWNQTEKLCFNEWSNPDDSELGIQIVKDLHRTGCSLFCGAAGQENQALLKRVLLAYARWNKSVGYCQGFNMLAALILQVMDRNETDSVKVMIYLIEGVLPESYFANNLRGLSVDMIVFRDLLRIRLPQLSKHLEALQNDAREGNSYEPPLTNVFTMQWFLTLFCNCLPQATVLRVWDLIFLEGNEILLRTAIAIWQKLSDRILAVNSADEFYSIMGVLTREMLEFGLVDSNTLIKTIVEIGTCNELNEMRDKYLYNITPWTQSVQTAARKGFKLFYSDDDETESDYDEKAAVTAAYGINIGRKRDKNQQNSKESNVIQPYAHGHPDRERLALDISALKKQYAKLRERQRQAHIILQAACARQPMGQNSSPGPIAMNHLLLGKNAIVNSRGRRLGPPKGSIPPARTKPIVKKKETAPVITGETIHWKDTEKFRRRQSVSEDTESSETFIPDSDSSSYSEDDDDASSTSTELCDEDNNRLSDFEEKTSNILEAKVGSIKNINSDVSEETSKLHEIKISEKIQSDIKNLVRDIDKLKTSDDFVKTGDTSDLKIDEVATNNDEPNLETLIRLSSEENEPNLIEIPDTPNENTNITPENENITLEENLQITTETTVTSPDVTTCGNLATKHDTNTEEILSQNEEDIFESFLQERVKLSKENSVESITSPTEEPHSLKPSEDKLRRHKSYEETPKNHFEKSFFKQASFDTNIVPTIETSLWKPYQIEEEAEDVQKTEFLQDCVKLSRENSLENITSPTEEPHNLKPSEDKLRRHKSYEETPKSNLEKSFFKQASFDTNVVPTIETSLWTPYQIEEEVEEIQQPETQHEKVKKQTSVDLLTVEDKRLEAGRRNSERALKIIQENSLILHRILLQQKSSDPDSEDETSRSPISKTFLRSESLLSKDEKTDEDRSSRDGDEELESGVESFSVSPAHLEEENDRSLKKEFEDETLIISKNIEGNTEVQYKYNYQTNEEKDQTGEDNLLASSEEINISPLTQNENNITSVSEINKNINISKNDVRETSNIQTDIVPSSKFIISPVISEDETSSLPINAINNFNQYTYATNDFKQPTSFLVSKEFSISPSTPDEKISSSVEPSFYNREDTQNIEEKSSITLPTSAYYNLSPIMPDEKNSSCILESATKNSEILSDSERNPNATSDFQDLTDFKLNISLFSKSDKYNLSPLTPNEKKIDIKTTGHEETPNLKPNCVFSSSIQYNLSPITPNEKNYLVETTNNKQLPDLQTKNMFSSSVQYNLSLVSPEEENIAFKTTAKEDLPNISDFSNLIHYNLSSITPDGKNVTNEATSDKEMSDFKSNICMISPLIDEKTNKESPDSKTNIMFPNNLSPETPDGKNIAVKTSGREESSNSKSNISVFSNSIQYNLSPLTPDEKKATNEIMLADISIMEKPKDINLSSTFKQYTSLITPEEPNASNLEALKNLELNTEELPNYQNISSFSNSKYFAAITPENDSRLKPNLTESPDIQNNTSSMSLPKYFSILPITPTDTNILSSQQTKVFDDTSKTDDHKEQYSIFPITPTNTNASNFVSSPDKIGHCNDFKKSSDKPTFSNQFTVSSVSPEVAPDTSNDRNITTYSTNIDDKSRLEIHSNMENISYKNIVTPDDISYKFSYKSSDVTKDSKKLESDSSEKSFSTSPVASKREEKSPDYLAYYKSDKLADSKETKSLFEELKDEIQFKIEETPKEASPYKYKYREDSDDSITEIRNRITAQRQNDNTALPTSTQYNFNSPIDSTENFSTKTDEATNYQPEDSKFNYKFSLESPEYYAKSNLPEPDLKPSIYSPDDVLSKTTDDYVSMPTKHIVKPFVYSPEDTTSTKDFDSTFRSKTQDFETKSDNNSVSSGQETKYDRTKLTIDLKPNKYNDISPEISPPKHLSCLQFTSFQADIPCTSKAIQFSPICAKEKSISPKSPKSPKYLLNLPTLSPPRRTLKSPSSPNRNFSPFPVQPIARQPKELGVKLGLYKDLNSPNK